MRFSTTENFIVKSVAVSFVPLFNVVKWTNDRRTTVTPTRWGRNRVPCSCCSACWCRDWYAPSHPAKVSKLPPSTKNTVLSRFLSIQKLDSWQSVTKEVVEYHFFRHEKRMLLPRRSLDKDSSRKITAILLFPTDPARAISWEIRSY